MLKYSAIVIVLAHFVAAKIDFAEQLSHCQKSLETIDSCLGQLLESIRPMLRTGIKELNIPILEPITLDDLNFVQRQGPVTIQARFRDLFVGGFSNFSLNSIKTNLDTLELTVRVFIPNLRVTGNYKLDGNLILLPITGNGPFRASLRDIDVLMKSKIVVKNEGIKERLGVANTKVNFQLGRARVRLRNLFNGDPILGETVNHFINNNNELILREVQPAISKDISSLVETLMDTAISALPVSLVKHEQAEEVAPA